MGDRSGERRLELIGIEIHREPHRRMIIEVLRGCRRDGQVRRGSGGAEEVLVARQLEGDREGRSDRPGQGHAEQEQVGVATVDAPCGGAYVTDALHRVDPSQVGDGGMPLDVDDHRRPDAPLVVDAEADLVGGEQRWSVVGHAPESGASTRHCARPTRGVRR